MTIKDKIDYAMKCKTAQWSLAENIFTKKDNVFLETDKIFFGVVTFGYNALIVADREIINWCTETLSDLPSNGILGCEYLYIIEKKLREYGKKLDGDYSRYLHLYPEQKVEKPQGFNFELYEKGKIPAELYADGCFNHSLDYDEKNELLAIVAKSGEEIASIAAVNNCGSGLWDVGIDTIDKYRGKGLAAYLVKTMALESEKRNQVPLYTTWHPNIASTRAALRAGFSPVWVEYLSENL